MGSTDCCVRRTLRSMKILILLSIALLLAACEPMPVPADGLDAATDASVTDTAPEASSDALPPHVDGGGID